MLAWRIRAEFSWHPDRGIVTFKGTLLQFLFGHGEF
jgi:hypothetical protein